MRPAGTAIRTTLLALVAVIVVVVAARGEDPLGPHQRMALFESSLQRCLTAPLASSSEETMRYQLSMCGFYVKPDVLQDEALKQDILLKEKVAGLDRTAYNQGMIHMETVTSAILRDSSLVAAVRENAVPSNSTVADVFADIWIGPSQYVGEWRRYGFLFDDGLLSRYGVAPGDTDTPVRLDVIAPIRDGSKDIELCIGSHHVTETVTQNCKQTGSSQQSTKYCELLSSGGCPKGHIFRPVIPRRSVLVLNAAVLRRYLGSESDLRQPRVDVHVVLRYGWWYSSPNSVWQTVTSALKLGHAIDLDSKDVVSGNSECSAATEDDCKPLLSEGSPSSTGRLFFANHDVESQNHEDVNLFFGDSRLIARLPPGRSVSLPTMAGTYTLRVDGVSRKIWRIPAANVTAALYASKDSLDFPMEAAWT